jgi:hypothetical protein
MAGTATPITCEATWAVSPCHGESVEPMTAEGGMCVPTSCFPTAIPLPHLSSQQPPPRDMIGT